MKKRICVIGSGPSGLACIKSCLEEGHDVVSYDKSDYIGGLWYYHKDDLDGVASVARSTIINTSKEMSAYSDFPPPKEFPNYMHNTKMQKYFEMYAENFGLLKYTKQKHEVVRVEPRQDFETSAKWIVKVKNLVTNETSTETFDGVLVCTGHHVYPNVPTFPGQENFKGNVKHTHSYKTPEGYEDKVVVVVGIGNSGVDAAVELSRVAKQVYLSTRRGAWVLTRVGPGGQPFDIAYSKRYNIFFGDLLGYNTKCAVLENAVNKRFDHEKYGLKPKHRILAAHPTINDALPDRILSGTIIVKGDIDHFTTNGILFKDDEKEIEVDEVVLATGYKLHFPFIEQSIIKTENNKVKLYKHMFPSHIAHPHTIALIGATQPLGCIMPISEIQARWYSLLMSGKLKLPSKEVMDKDIEKKQEEMRKRYYESPRHTIQVDFLPYMDELATQAGVKPTLFKYFFTDPKLWGALFWGPAIAYQYRLNGPHSWSGAREAIMNLQERVEAGLSGSTALTKKKTGGILAFLPLTALVFLFSSIGYKYQHVVLSRLMELFEHTARIFN